MKIQRIQAVEDYILTEGSVSLDKLSKHFDVSKNTMRRDIDEIIKGGRIKKVYGGVVAVEAKGLLPFDQRKTANRSDKQKICRFASEMIKSGSIVFIDSGTTTRYLLDYLPYNISATILTNSLDIINTAVSYPNIRLLVLGNTLKRETRSLVDVVDWSYYSKMNIDIAFMAATGLSLARGVTNSDLREYDIKNNIVNAADKSVLLVDSAKFERTSLVTYAPIKSFQHIITSNGVPQEYKVYCAENKIVLTEL